MKYCTAQKGIVHNVQHKASEKKAKQSKAERAKRNKENKGK
jgi:hypothetical protein